MISRYRFNASYYFKIEPDAVMDYRWICLTTLRQNLDLATSFI